MISEKITFERFGYYSHSLTKGSHKKVVCICDYCNSECEKAYKNRVNSNIELDKDACKNCKNKKNSELCLIKYGVDNHSKRKEIKELLSNTDYESLKDKVKEMLTDGYSSEYIAGKLECCGTVLREYIRKWNFDMNSFKDGRAKTCIEKYGEDFSKKIADMSKSAVLDKYGVENQFQRESVKAKIKDTVRSKYGVDHPLQDKKILEKQKSTLYNRYGVDSASKIHQKKFSGLTLKEVAENSNYSYTRTCHLIKKYGYEQFLQMEPYESSIEAIISSLLLKHDIPFTKGSVDRYRPDFIIGNIIVECDGLYYHSETIQKDNNYHVKKRQCYINNGYSPLFFRENEIENSLPIVESMLLNKLGKSNKIHARKCELTTITPELAKDFFSKNHLMGHGKGSGFGLIYNNNLVAAILIKRKDGEMHEISRFCNTLGYNVIGGFSKLIKFAQSNMQFKQLMTFIDLRYGSGHYLSSLGFDHKNTSISFKWTNGSEVFNRQKFLGNSGYDKGLVKIWDCGQAKYSVVYN